MKKGKILTTLAVFAATLLLSAIPVSAQYDSDFTPGQHQDDNSEVFGINADEGDTISFFPGGCGIIESINLKVNKSVTGTVRVTSHGEENPADNKNKRDLGRKVVEFCEIELEGFSSEDIDSSIVRVKAEKFRLEEVGVNSDDLRLFQFNNGAKKWEQLDTPKKSESAINFFYETDQVNQYSYYAGAEKLSGLNIGTLPLVICGFLLLLALIILLIVSSLGRREEDEPRTQNRRI